MAMKPTNIDRALYRAPETDAEIMDLQDQQDAFYEVDVTTDEEEQEQESVQVSPEPDDFFGNLVGSVSDSTLDEVSSYVLTNAEEDRASRKDWEDSYTRGLDLLGLKYENRTEPFDGATGVTHPILNEAVTQFQAQAYKELLPSSGPVRAQIIGTANPMLEQQAQRVQEYLNYQIMYNMEEYEPEYDQMLYFLGLAGSAFKKVYRDTSLNRPVSKFITSEDILVSYSATDLKSAERVTHVIKISENELRKLQVSGVYADMELTGSASRSDTEIQEKYDDLEGRDPSDRSQDYTLYECHCYFNLEEFPDENEIKLPYIITVCVDTEQVLSIRRNYSPEDTMKNKIPHFVQYKFTPGLGFYGFGLIHLLGNLSRTATANLRQLIDAGTLANMPAGFKARGLRIADDSDPLQPGEFRDVDVPGGDLKSSLIPLPYKEPSATLFQLMGFVVGSAEKFVGTSEIGVGDGRQEMPVGTTIALLERGSRIISAIHKRLHASLKLELKMIATLFAEDPTPYPYDVGADPSIKAQDFDPRIDVIPVSDPNIFSMSQRVVLAQEQLKLAQASPQMHNMYESYRRMYEALGVDQIDQILTPPNPPQPKDPGTENNEIMKVIIGQGELKAFPEQDHDAHIAVHQAYMLSKASTLQPQIATTLENHVYEHLTLKAQNMVQQEMGQADMKNPQVQMAMQSSIARKQAELIAEYQQQYPPQPNSDPLVEIKKQELAIREQDNMANQQLDQMRLDFDKVKQQENVGVQKERIDSTEDIAEMRAKIAMERTQQAHGGNK
tara:strand:+ start:831 stop:3176 length:2346 start_codon:yes stop_codon:yes gene_type:complete